ncbi:MAG: DUF501 domain-containing protein [Halanaerobiales bacterium]|nr:DUF501 domain-containing protein [Halanaerobiales bacterium]
MTHQLGRSPRNLAGVAVRCAEGFPQVVVTHPFIFHGEFPEIFPTLYWFTCPRLVKEISRIESSGVITQIQEQINNDPKLKEDLNLAYRIYADKRMELVQEPTFKLIQERYPTQYDVLLNSGVAGIMEQGIKCLHAHFADYLVNEVNPVGRLTAELLGDKMNVPCRDCAQD